MDADQREQLYESVGKSLPVGRVGEAHDVPQAYLFLMQEGFSTGQTVVVDGGTVLVLAGSEGWGLDRREWVHWCIRSYDDRAQSHRDCINSGLRLSTVCYFRERGSGSRVSPISILHRITQ
jgi:hypothetical protein